MSKDRHTRVSVKCEVCTREFLARKERVDKGQGRFCSKGCFDFFQRDARKPFYGRKDLATRYKTGNGYSARWYDENGKTRTTSYPRWWWEMNIGEIPDGMIILYKDGNPLNIASDNFELGTKSDALKRGNQTRKSDPQVWKAYTDKLRLKSTGRRHSEDTRKKQSISAMNRSYTTHGDRHPNWRGGIPKEYPKEFYEVRKFVIDRDNGRCQICSKVLVKNPHVHHRDGDRNNNDQNNLLTLCASCHGKVHSKSNMESLPIMALRSELHWNK